MLEQWQLRLRNYQFTPKKIAAVGLGVSLLAGLGFYVFIHIPLQAAAQEMHGQAAAMAGQVTQIGNFSNAHINDKTYLQELDKRQAQVDKALPAQMTQGQFWAGTERLAQNCGIQLLGLAPQGVETGREYSTMAVKVHVSGTYYSLLAFLQGLRDGERLVTVKDMALQAQSGKIDGTLWLNIYAVSDK
jgi:type IV pilus assembly protein PilO